MRVFVINLAQRSDRLDFMTAQLDALKMPFTRIEAINGLDDADIGYPVDHARLSKGEFACYLSHVRLWQQFIDTGESHCLLLEDDVKLAKSLPKVLAHTSFYPKQCAVLRLERRDTSSLLSRFGQHVHKGRKAYRLHNFEGGSGALVLSREYALHLLKNHTTPVIPVDNLVMHPTENDFAGFRIFQAVPAAAVQRLFLEKCDPDYNAESDLQTERVISAKKRPPKGMRGRILAHLKQRRQNFYRNVFLTHRIVQFDKD